MKDLIEQMINANDSELPVLALKIVDIGKQLAKLAKEKHDKPVSADDLLPMDSYVSPDDLLPMIEALICSGCVDYKHDELMQLSNKLNNSPTNNCAGEDASALAIVSGILQYSIEKLNNKSLDELFTEDYDALEYSDLRKNIKEIDFSSISEATKQTIAKYRAKCFMNYLESHQLKHVVNMEELEKAVCKYDKNFITPKKLQMILDACVKFPEHIELLGENYIQWSLIQSCKEEQEEHRKLKAVVFDSVVFIQLEILDLNKNLDEFTKTMPLFKEIQCLDAKIRNYIANINTLQIDHLEVINKMIQESSPELQEFIQSKSENLTENFKALTEQAFIKNMIRICKSYQATLGSSPLDRQKRKIVDSAMGKLNEEYSFQENLKDYRNVLNDEKYLSILNKPRYQWWDDFWKAICFLFYFENKPKQTTGSKLSYLADVSMYKEVTDLEELKKQEPRESSIELLTISSY